MIVFETTVPLASWILRHVQGEGVQLAGEE
jgi:hypothetical protein